MTGGHTIDVWQVDTDAPAAELATLHAALSPAERALAANGSRRRWAAGRGALRLLLASYLDCAPAAATFAHGSHGKPAIDGLWFSFSDSGGTALVAVSRAGPVGVDVERVDVRRPVRRIAGRVFAEDEVAALGKLPPAPAAAAFHRCWSAKEAYAKGVGLGLTIGFDTFSVAPMAAPECDRVHVRGWDVRSLEVAEGYAAAVAAPGSDWRYDARRWTATS